MRKLIILVSIMALLFTGLSYSQTLRGLGEYDEMGFVLYDSQPDIFTSVEDGKSRAFAFSLSLNDDGEVQETEIFQVDPTDNFRKIGDSSISYSRVEGFTSENIVVVAIQGSEENYGFNLQLYRTSNGAYLKGDLMTMDVDEEGNTDTFVILGTVLFKNIFLRY